MSHDYARENEIGEFVEVELFGREFSDPLTTVHVADIFAGRHAFTYAVEDGFMIVRMDGRIIYKDKADAS